MSFIFYHVDPSHEKDHIWGSVASKRLKADCQCSQIDGYFVFLHYILCVYVQAVQFSLVHSSCWRCQVERIALWDTGLCSWIVFC